MVRTYDILVGEEVLATLRGGSRRIQKHLQSLHQRGISATMRRVPKAELRRRAQEEELGCT